MIQRIKVSGTIGKGLMAKLNTTAMGKSFELPPLMPALTHKPVVAFIVEKEDNFWTMACVWCGIRIGDVQASVNDGLITLESV